MEQAAKRLVCLSMVVSEQDPAIVKRALESVLPHITHWCVVDDGGSAPEVLEVVRQALGALPGKLLTRPWVNFGHNRTEALRDAERVVSEPCYVPSNAPMYVLVLDADQTFHGDLSGLDPAADVHEIMLHGFAHGAYPMRKLTRVGCGCSYTGATHEEFVLPAGAKVARLDTGHMVEHADSSRRKSGRKATEDQALLEQALVADPENVRAAFYLACLYRDTGQHEKALSMFLRRANMGGYWQERYVAWCNAGRLHEQLRHPWSVTERAFDEAIEIDPSRAEAHCDQAAFFRRAQLFNKAYAAAKRAASKTLPDYALFPERHKYGWMPRDEMALAMFNLGNFAEAVRLTEQLLHDEVTPPTAHAHLRENLRWYREKLPQITGGAALEAVVVSSAHDVTVLWAIECLESVAAQTVPVRHIYTVNAGMEGLDRLRAYVAGMPNGGRIEIREVDGPNLFVEQAYRIAQELPPATVMLLVDGDDYLLARDAVERVLAAHAAGALVTYGQFEPIPASTWGRFRASPYSADVVVRAAYREEHWCATHLKTLRAGVLARIKEQDLRGPEGQWIRYCWDQAVMLPALEMVAERGVFIADPIYGYRTNNPASDHNSGAVALGEAELRYVRSLPKYARLTSWP
jgi:hypothetical protein